jgi:repressor LexA
VLELIADGLRVFGVAPTLREIRDRLGLRSIGTVQDHVRALELKGVVQRYGRRARGLSVVGFPPSALVPILGTVPAGLPFEAVETTEGWISVGAGRILGKTLFALRVRGDSMRDAAIVNGDVVIVEKTTEAGHGDIVVALIEGDATVKYLALLAESPVLRAANQEYAPLPLVNENWRILGRVVGLWRDV